MSYKEIASCAARDFCRALFASYGFSAEESGVISEVLLAADFAGIESHGVHRIVRYHEEITSGCVDVHAKIEVLRDTPPASVLDAHKAMGQLAGAGAMERAIGKAREHGIGIVSVRDSNHIGIAGYYAELAARAGFIGLCMTNSEAIAVPTFGSAGMLGTNAVAFVMDAEPVMLSIDFSTTVVPRGTIEVYAKNGTPLPEGWAVDARGQISTDAAAVIDGIVRKAGGGILPLGGAGTLTGGHKGFGLGIIVEIFCGILSGGLTSNYINRERGHTGICNCFIALDPALFGGREEIRERLSVFLRELRESPKAEGQARIWTPGERSAELRARLSGGAIPVSTRTLDELRVIARAQNISPLA